MFGFNKSTIATAGLPIQKQNHGTGPLYHRIYQVLVVAPYEKCEEVMERLKADINFFSPQMIASFEKTKGQPSTMNSEDEYDVKLGVPVDAPVRVKVCQRHRFVLSTLENHIEAGEISFSLQRRSGGALFKIESFARSRDSIIDFLYDKIPLARFAQGSMWQMMCAKFASECLPDSAPKAHVVVKTIRRDEKSGQWEVI